MIYFDNAATTKVEDDVLNALLPYLKENYGNPSSQHRMGYDAREAVESARKKVAETINAKPEQIIFTSGGTESNNLVLDNFEHVCCGKTEHHSVLNHKSIHSTFMVEKYSQNYKPKHIKSLCSFMYVNNEVGTINSIKELAKEVHEKGGLIHSDMVQALGHIPIDVQELDVDFASFSGHKIGAPKGVGFLYAKHPYYLKNTLAGGEQESGYRAGTENVAGIVGLGKACEIVQMSLSRNLKVYEALYTRLLFEIDNMPGVYINCVLHNRVENIVNLQVKDVQASQLVEYMNENEIYVSSGSACTSKSGKSSHVLTAFGYSEKEANESIRISFNPHNTYKEVDEFIKVLKEFIKIVRDFE